MPAGDTPLTYRAVAEWLATRSRYRDCLRRARSKHFTLPGGGAHQLLEKLPWRPTQDGDTTTGTRDPRATWLAAVLRCSL